MKNVIFQLYLLLLFLLLHCFSPQQGYYLATNCPRKTSNYHPNVADCNFALKCVAKCTDSAKDGFLHSAFLLSYKVRGSFPPNAPCLSMSLS